ncbi:MAG: MbcA/ParS/Xre antitoxin family protein [Rhodospirillales bacterium]|nr:MbcA/ParS/Xre antitoxin family protein [Rhodospirillales bacterium]
MMQPDLLQTIIDRTGRVQVDRMAEIFHITKAELANATGLSRDAVSKTARLDTRATQSRLLDTVQIVNRVLPWCGSVMQAYAWYRSQPLPSFGDKTAEDLVKEGRAEAVKSYLSRIAEGGYA